MNINPDLWQRPELQKPLADHDFAMIFDYLKVREGISQRQLARLLGRSQSLISEIMSNGRKVQMYAVLEDFAKRLSIPRGAMGLAFFDDLVEPKPTGGEEDEEVERRRLFANGAAAVFGEVVFGPVTDFFLPTKYATSTPSRVGISDVDRVRAVTAFSRWLDGVHGGGSCSEILCSQLAGFDRLLGADIHDKIRRLLFAAVGDAYLVAARAQAELGDLRIVRALLARALELAKVSDRSLLATVLVNVAHVYGRHGDADDGLKFSQFSELAMPNGIPAADAAIHEAWLYAKLGYSDQAAKYMEKARHLHEKHHTDDRVAPWLAGFNAHGPVGLTEACYRELAGYDSAFLDSAVEASIRAMPPKQFDQQSGWSIIPLSRAAELHLKSGEKAEGLRLAEETVTMTDHLWVVGAHTKQILSVDLTQALRSYQDSTASDLAHRLSKLAA